MDLLAPASSRRPGAAPPSAFKPGRIVDLSKGGARELGILVRGGVPVTVTAIP